MNSKEKKELSETSICNLFITPAIQKAGWDPIKQIRWEVTLTPGPVVVRGDNEIVAIGNRFALIRQRGDTAADRLGHVDLVLQGIIFPHKTHRSYRSCRKKAPGLARPFWLDRSGRIVWRPFPATLLSRRP